MKYEVAAIVARVTADLNARKCAGMMDLEPYIEDTDERNQEFRCQVRREQPFRSTTNDVAQVTNRCNVDFQILMCAPEETAGAVQDDSPAPAQPPKRRRLAKKSKKGELTYYSNII